MKPIVIFYHCYNPQEHCILDEQLESIKKSGLYDAMDKMIIHYCGDLKLNDPKIQCIEHDQFDSELPTLKLIHTYAKANDCNILYMHTKGASRTSAPIVAWRLYMSFFCVNKWKDAVKMLEHYDTYGVEFHQQPSRHYSGNFWWATSEHIKQLAEPAGSRLDQEFWVTKNGNCVVAHDAGINLYTHAYEIKELNDSTTTS